MSTRFYVNDIDEPHLQPLFNEKSIGKNLMRLQLPESSNLVQILKSLMRMFKRVIGKSQTLTLTLGPIPTYPELIESSPQEPAFLISSLDEEQEEGPKEPKITKQLN